MLPVATLPVAALFMGIGYAIDPSGWGGGNVFAAFLIKAGGTILDNLGILFAVGLAYGMSKDKDGAAALTGLVSFLVPMTLLNSAAVAMFQGIEVEKVATAFGAINNKNVFIGILAGLIGAAMYNKFSGVKLPMAFSFFSGRRLVPIVTSFVMLAVSAILLFVWPAVYGGLVTFGEFISKMGPLGAGLYGFFNRLLIPTGMHHALNNVFWFNIAGIDDIAKFWSGDGVKGVTGMYQAGFFPVMMFGLPAGALAIYQNARPEKKKATASLMLAAAVAAFTTGVTEPLEFSFMFVAWPLYVVHAILTGISMFIAATFHWTAGFNFSAGLIDYILSFNLPLANKPFMLLVLGLVMAVVYYVVFTFMIRTFNLMTPGREEGDGEEMPDIDNNTTADNKFQVLASRIYKGLGGIENVESIDNCTTRLRLIVKDSKNVNETAIKSTGVPGMRVLDDKNVQVIVGTEVQFVADEMKKIQQSGGAGLESVQTSTPVVEQKASETKGGKDDFFAVADGEVISISDVEDDVFSEKMMGDGYAVRPTSNAVYTPVAGKITSIFPTKHAMGIQTESGAEVLLHMGIDTVQLQGEPFTLAVEEGQVVKKGDKVAEMDLSKVKEAGKKTDIIIAFTNMDAISNVELSKANQTAKANDVVGKVIVK
ncbi:PTS system, N-acetylglucosamine-specific IIC component [Pilibacter termitis]|uniref:PTS system, N-acetylglucosamine-specific IIC component n=2 Tax=Pilibacter termitis TaxID=263852 RepID=A0A1T4QA09_9ENTE|nr:PTS system, N-acetylglucosamine-specific IIC component [Pilibacter termitis]